MAQEIVHWCEVEFVEGKRVAGNPEVISIGDSGPVAIDLCSDCYAQLVAPLAKVLQEGRPLEVLPPVPEQREHRHTKSPAALVVVDCPVCESDGVKHTCNRSSMRDHMKRAHKTTLSKVESMRGATLDGRPLPHKCPVRGCGLAFSTVQGVAVHGRREHDTEGTSKSVVQAKARAKA